MEITDFDLIEHIDKNAGSNGYSHDKVYIYLGTCRMKDISSGKWFDACMYKEWDKKLDNTVGETFIREKESFEKEFKVYETKI
jgi:hypothetical protein